MTEIILEEVEPQRLQLFKTESFMDQQLGFKNPFLGECIKVKKLSPDAIIPTKAYFTDAGWDLYALEDRALYKQTPTKIPTGIAMEIPEGFYGQIQGRSGLGSKGISILGGVIDSAYRGDITVCLNLDNIGAKLQTPYIINKGDKIAQLVIHKLPLTYLEEVEELEESDRGQKGFGSSGR